MKYFSNKFISINYFTCWDFKKFTRVLHLHFMMNRNKLYNRAKGVNCNKPLRRYSNDSEDLQPDKSYQPRERPPPHLRGKALGLWYRDRQRNKQGKQDREPEAIPISLENYKVREIENLLSATSPIKKKEEGPFKRKFHRDDISFEEKLDMIENRSVIQNHTLDEQMYDELMDKVRNNTKYKEMFEFRKKLPAFGKRNEIIDAIHKNQIVVISGETGSGKTTQAVQYVLDSFIEQKKGSLCEIVCTQPRRISAITVAERVAAERAENLGVSIGYQIRLQSILPSVAKGKITFVTTGVLIQWLQSNPSLQGISHLFVDEIHERDTSSDFLLALLKFILPKRPDLRIVLMSATLSPEKFSAYFGDAPMVHIPGFTYPVEEIYLEELLEKIPFHFPPPRGRLRRASERDPVFENCVLPYVYELERSHMISKSVAHQLSNPESERLNIDFICSVILHICTHEPEGAILVFLPGLSHIQDTIKCLSSQNYFRPSRTLIIPMHSIVSTSMQKKAFYTPPRGVRKIIISTSICETSITIDDVRYVVDCGRMKMKNFDLSKNVETLEPEWETTANAKQRRGRAGRTRSGLCYKLFTKAREDMFELYPLPDIQKCRLEEVILKGKTLNLGRIGPFLEKLMDPPDPKAVELSLKMLRTLNLLDDDERLTPLGYHVSKLPVDPQTGKMILMGAIFSCLDPILSIAACLSYRDPFEFVFGNEKLIQEKRAQLSDGEKSDHYIFSNAVIGWEEAESAGQSYGFATANCLSDHHLRLLSKMKRQFAECLHDMKFLVDPNPKHPQSNRNSQNASLIKALVCSGLYPNVAMIKRQFKSKVTGESKMVLWKTVDHPRVQLHIKSFLCSVKKFESPYIVYFEKMKSSEIYIHDATMVYPMALLFFGEKCNIVDGNIVVDDMIRLSCKKRTAFLVQKLRHELVSILEQAVSNPGVLHWEKESRKILVLKSIIQLITSEDKTSVDECDLEME